MRVMRSWDSGSTFGDSTEGSHAFTDRRAKQRRDAFYRYNAWGAHTDSGSRSTTLMTSSAASLIAERNVLRYAGYVWDRQAGLYYLQARYYDPDTRLFLTRDPAKADGPQSAYMYAASRPIVVSDPTGLRPNAVPPGVQARRDRKQAAEAGCRNWAQYYLATNPAPWWATKKWGTESPFVKRSFFVGAGSVPELRQGATARCFAAAGLEAANMVGATNDLDLDGFASFIGLDSNPRDGCDDPREYAKWQIGMARRGAVAVPPRTKGAMRFNDIVDRLDAGGALVISVNYDPDWAMSTATKLGGQHAMLLHGAGMIGRKRFVDIYDSATGQDYKNVPYSFVAGDSRGMTLSKGRAFSVEGFEWRNTHEVYRASDVLSIGHSIVQQFPFTSN
jgi:RHS repeat-associated protein